MAIDIKAELQQTNNILLAMAGMAKQAIEDGIRLGGQEPPWSTAIEFLSDLALEELGKAEERVYKELNK